MKDDGKIVSLPALRLVNIYSSVITRVHSPLPDAGLVTYDVSGQPRVPQPCLPSANALPEHRRNQRAGGKGNQRCQVFDL
jgi:hypothetical protein